MNIHIRLNQLRTQLGLTTRAFGGSINLSGGAITNMEKGRRDITERTAKDICREYNVNLDWLVNGNGSMFKNIIDELKIDDEVKDVVRLYSLLPENEKILFRQLLSSWNEKT